MILLGLSINGARARPLLGDQSYYRHSARIGKWFTEAENPQLICLSAITAVSYGDTDKSLC